MPVRLVLPLLAMLALAVSAHATDAGLEQQVMQAFSGHDYAAAERLCRQLLEKQPGDGGASYNLACALARQDKLDDAVKALADAAEHGFSDSAHAKEDEDLAAIRGRADFAAIVAKMDAHPYGADQPYEGGAEIPGLRTVEEQPSGGLRYRLRIGKEASAEHPHRLIVWLHPSGGSANRPVESLAASLAERGFALAVFTQKQWRGWTGAEMGRLGPSVSAMMRQEGIERTAPIFMGFSAGGQAALTLWYDNPKLVSALILDAAYPIDLSKGMQARAVQQPSTEAFAAKTPMIALVGGQDGGLQIWNDALAKWKDKEMPIALRVVPGHGHEYLFHGAEWAAVLDWLKALPPGVPVGKGAGDAAKAPASKAEAPVVP
jgi:predicted esterase